MIHLDVKKVGTIPDGGGWRIHGRGSTRALAGKRAHKQRVGYTYLHTAIDGYSRLAYTEALDNETATTRIGFFCRARAFFTAHGITRLVRVVTDNGANYRARTFVRTVTAHAARHQRTGPYTPRHNGKVERYQRLLTEECLYAHAFESETERRQAISTWVHHYNYHRPHTACADQPPATRVHTHVTNVMPSYTRADSAEAKAVMRTGSNLTSSVGVACSWRQRIDPRRDSTSVRGRHHARVRRRARDRSRSKQDRQ